VLAPLELFSSKSAHEAIHLVRCEKKHHEKQVIGFDYLQFKHWVLKTTSW